MPAIRRVVQPAVVMHALAATLALLPACSKPVEPALRTTFIVGFPNETDAEFAELLSFVRETRFDALGAFVYSPEPPARPLSGSAPACPQMWPRTTTAA